jgi:hypothetical protein
MSDLRDLISPVFEEYRQRVKNPIWGGFVLSWIFINWEILLIVLFSNETVENKIIEIKTNYISICSNVILPLVISIAYYIAIPYLISLTEKIRFTAYKVNENNRAQKAIERLKATGKIIEQEAANEDLRIAFRSKNDLNKKFEVLEEQLKNREDVIATLEKEIKQLGDSHLQLQQMYDEAEKERVSYLHQLQKINDENLTQSPKPVVGNSNQNKIDLEQFEEFRTDLDIYLASLSIEDLHSDYLHQIIDLKFGNKIDNYSSDIYKSLIRERIMRIRKHRIDI